MFRNKSILILCFAAALGMAAGVAHADLVGHWPLDEGQGMTAYDVTDNGNNGTLRGDPQWVPGVMKTALQFDADDDVDCGNDPSLNLTGPLSIAVWIKPDLDESAAIAPLSKATSAAAGWSWQLRYGWSSPQPYMGFQFNADTRVWVYANQNLVVGEWYHLAAAHDGSTVKCYLNGEETDSASMGSIIGGADAPFYIGQDGWNDNWEGAIDDVRLYDHGLSPDEVMAAMKGSPPELSANPVPENEATDVIRDSQLSWTPGEFAGTHNVYLGTSFDEVTDATAATASGLDVNAFDPGRLEFGQTYFWRVDEVNATPDRTVFKGEVWSFTVEPYAILIPIDIDHVTASSSAQMNPPEMTVNGSGLNGMTHGAAPDTMWLSNAPDLNPWLMYEFDRVEQLDQMRVWNSNSASEAFIGWGIKDVGIETSMDGVDWTVLIDSTQLARAPGLPTYDAPQAIDLGLVQAKYVRLNIQSGWGGVLPQYGLSEVQFYGLPVYARDPIPASGAADVRPDAVAAWRAGRQASQHTVYLSEDPDAVADGAAPSATSVTNQADLGAFDLQMSHTYYWRVDEVNEAEAAPVWAGPVWSLTTADAVVVDDFESYTNKSPYRPFQTWLDGYGYSADEFFPVEYLGNGTGAGVGHDIWSPGSPDFNGQLMETASTIAGSGQSMPFYYSNTGGVASKTTRSFTPPQDWTVGGAKVLSIAFNGQAGNTGSLYVVINSTKVVYDSGSSPLAGIGRSLWQTWNIDLASLATNLQSVTQLEIGVEGSGASGRLLIDDIRLYPEAVDTEISKDITTPGDVVKGVPDDGDWPAAESPDLAIDNSTATKFLHRKGGAMATGIQIEPMVGATVVTGLTLTTANDTPTRDPITFELSGSNASIDGPYEVIASGNIVDFSGATAWPRLTRNETPIEFANTKSYKYYQIVFPTLRGATETLMQIAEVELITN
ncbi:MAG: discoidin domain-containing protein [Phycisphaerae bacterium]|nr:discoidin domain-containing protein [Phycisphaerae bacterium]